MVLIAKQDNGRPACVPACPLGDTRAFSDVIVCLHEEGYILRLREMEMERIANFATYLDIS